MAHGRATGQVDTCGLATLAGVVDRTGPLPVAQRERGSIPRPPIDPADHARIVAAFATLLTRCEQVNRRLAFVGLDEDRRLVESTDAMIARVRGWFQP